MQKLVKITKLEAVDSPTYPTPEWDKYIPGQDNGCVSLPVDYTIKGELHNLPEEGNVIYVARTERSGEEVSGKFCSSIVRKITSNDENDSLIIETLNSVYIIEYLPSVWKSYAKWPHPGANLWTADNVSSDEHGSKAAAEATTKILVERGLGGDGKIYPLRVWTALEEVLETADRLNKVLLDAAAQGE